MNKRQVSSIHSVLLDVSDAFSFNFHIARTKKPSYWTQKATLALSPLAKEDLPVLSGIHHGDEDGFLKLIDRYHPALQGFVQTFGGEKTDIEKFMAETWETVLQNLHLFDRDYSLKLWIYEVFIEQAQLRFSHPKNNIGTARPASRKLMNSHMPGNKEEGEEQKCTEFFGSNDLPISRQNSAHNSNGVGEIILKKMELALNQLPLKQKQVMYLRDVEQFTSDEVFFLLQIEDSHQRRLLKKSRETMRIFLDKALNPSSTVTSSQQLPCSNSSQKPH